MAHLDSQTLNHLVELISQETMVVLRQQGRTASAVTSQQALLKADIEQASLQLNDNRSTVEVAHLIDHTLLKPEATAQEIGQLCHEALLYGFASVCINPTHVKLAAQILQGSAVKVCTVIGFPLGATSTPAKVSETEQAINEGAAEIDMVINIGALKDGDNHLVEQDIAGVVRAAHNRGALVKVIIETALLTEEEKVRACRLAKKAGADFVKTSTGFSKAGATVEDVALMRRAVGPGLGVKAAGGIRTLADAQKMIAAGATRIGASAGVKIVQEAHAS